MSVAEHLRKRGAEGVDPSPRFLRLWWGRLNRSFFKGRLRPCQLTHGRSEFPNCDGLCYPLVAGLVHIHIDRAVKRRDDLLSTMAHEMVHQWQHQAGRHMGHGPDFQRWKARLAKHGLKI
jgi:SprT-like family